MWHALRPARILQRQMALRVAHSVFNSEPIWGSMSTSPGSRRKSGPVRTLKGKPPPWPPAWTILAHGISTGRYTDPAFAKLEYDNLWGHVWQVAARHDEIPEAGDFTVYDIGDQSVLVVRAGAASIKAYHNVCPHRGTALGRGAGRFPARQIMCPFHGWRWDLHGRNKYVLERQEFCDGRLADADVALREIQCVVFAGFVFINFDERAVPFEDFIAPIRSLLEDLAIGEMHHYWWKSLPIAANWKTAQEAFFETYHVPATHPQLELGAAEFISGRSHASDYPFNHRDVKYETYAGGHGRFFVGEKTPMAGHIQADGDDPIDIMAGYMQLLADGMDAQVLQADIDVLRTLRGKSFEAGSNLGAEYVNALYANAAGEQRPMPQPKPEVLGMWGGEIFIFPNIMILPQGGNAMMYRSRPVVGDPDRCVFEIYSTRSYPAAAKLPRAVVQPVTDFSDPKQVLLIPRQDLGNIPRIQQGLHSRGITHTLLAGQHEKIILNMHQELDRYLQA
jgi:phenylpropionate dioxygenase-like ring-hydroxylating dioxygenase large terminal subunit